MRKHGIDMWVVPMREYNEDPVFSSITAPETFFAPAADDLRVLRQVRRRPARRSRRRASNGIALGGTSQGGVFDARTSMKAVTAAVGGRQAELWGDEQWMALKQVIEERKPKVIGIDRSTTFAFSDGLSSGELQGMSAALGPAWTTKFKDAERLPLELIASKLPEEEAFFEKMTDAGLADDADDVFREGHRAGDDAHERPRVVVAAAHQRSGPGHLVPAEHRSSAEGHDE